MHYNNISVLFPSVVVLPVSVASFGPSSAGVAQAFFLVEFPLRQGEMLNREEANLGSCHLQGAIYFYIHPRIALP